MVNMTSELREDRHFKEDIETLPVTGSMKIDSRLSFTPDWKEENLLDLSQE